MAFGDKVNQLKVPEWRTKFVRYNKLKKVVQSIRHIDTDSGDAFVIDSTTLAEILIVTTTSVDSSKEIRIEEQESFYKKEFRVIQAWLLSRFPSAIKPFVTELLVELERINEFYERTERKYASRQAQLHIQIAMYRKLRARYGRDGSMKQLEQLTKYIREHYHSLELLLGYRGLNYIAFIKLMNRLNEKLKHSQQAERYLSVATEFRAHLNKQYFYYSPILKACIAQMEHSFKEDIEQGDDRKAIQNVSRYIQFI
jgi:SPX domain protein involved in polyphosphate accumulation